MKKLAIIAARPSVRSDIDVHVLALETASVHELAFA